jgi:hypothetical protein
MKHHVLALALGLCGCATLPPAPPPAVLADRTRLDEQAGLAITTGYRAAVAAARLANQVRPFDAATRTKAADLEARAFAAVAAVRAAYEAGNARDHAEAVAKARALIERITALVGGAS